MGLVLPAVDSTLNLTFKHFIQNKKEFKQNLERRKDNYHSIHTDKVSNDYSIEVTKLKNEYFRNKFFQDGLKNRKKMGHVIKDLLD